MFDPYFNVVVDERVTPFIGYCPHCPIQEGVRTHERLVEVTRETRQCPRCGRIYVVLLPSRESN